MKIALISSTFAAMMSFFSHLYKIFLQGDSCLFSFSAEDQLGQESVSVGRKLQALQLLFPEGPWLNMRSASLPFVGAVSC